MDIGVVQNVNTSRATIDVLVHGVGREYIQNDVPIVRNSDTISVIPKVGARCLIANVGNEMVCMGYLPTEGPQSQEANDEQDLQAGDTRIGNEQEGQIGVLEGGMLVALANGTGMIVLREKREVDIVGKDVAIDTPTVHKYYKTDDLGGADVNESVYSTVGKVEGKNIKANDGTYEHTIDRVHSVKLEVNKGATTAELIALGQVLQDLTVTIATDVGDIELGWDINTHRFTLNVPGELEITAQTLIRLLAPIVGINCPGTNPLQGLVNGTFRCLMTGTELGLTGQQLLTVQGGDSGV